MGSGADRHKRQTALALLSGAAVSDAPVEGQPDGDQKKQRRWEGVAYSGGAFGQMYGEVVFDLATMQLPEGGRKLISRESHVNGQRVGAADTFKITERGLEVGGYFLTNARAQALVDDIDAGAPIEISAITEYEAEWVPEGHTVNVNGRTFEGPLILGHNARPRAIDLVEVGADYGAVVERVAASLDTTQLEAGGRAMADDDKGKGTGDEGTAEADGGRMVDIDALTLDEIREMRPDLFEAATPPDDDAGDAEAAASGTEAPDALDDEDKKNKQQAAASIEELEAIKGIEDAEVIGAFKRKMSVSAATFLVENRKRVAVAAAGGAHDGVRAPRSAGVGDAGIDGDGGAGGAGGGGDGKRVTASAAYDQCPAFAAACLARAGGDEDKARAFARSVAQSNLDRGKPVDHISFLQAAG